MLVDVNGYVIERCPNCFYQQRVVRRHPDPKQPKYRHKLNRQVAQRIRLLARKGWTRQRLAREYLVSETSIGNVLKWVTYQDPAPPPSNHNNHKHSRAS